MTLEEYREMSAIMFGKNSGATRYFEAKIDEQGPDEPVLAPESQMIALMISLDKQGRIK